MKHESLPTLRTLLASRNLPTGTHLFFLLEKAARGADTDTMLDVELKQRKDSVKCQTFLTLLDNMQTFSETPYILRLFLTWLTFESLLATLESVLATLESLLAVLFHLPTRIYLYL